MSETGKEHTKAFSAAAGYTFRKNKNRTDIRCADPCKSLLGKFDATIDYAIQIKCHQRSCKKLNSVANHKPDKLVDFRCTAIDDRKSKRADEPVVCNKLLAKISPGTAIQIRCPRCGAFVESITEEE